MTARQAWAVGGSVILAGAVNVATGMLTENWSVAWGAGAAVLLLLSAAVAVWRARTEGAPARLSSPPERSQEVPRGKSGGSVRLSLTIERKN